VFVPRAQVRVLNRPAAVYACPQAWDAVTFYLRPDDVRSVTPDSRVRMMAELYRQPDAVLFVKTADLKEEFSH